MYVAVKMNYADDIEGLLMNGAKSTFCDYVSSSCYLKSQMSLYIIFLVVVVITNVFTYNVLHKV